MPGRSGRGGETVELLDQASQALITPRNGAVTVHQAFHFPALAAIGPGEGMQQGQGHLAFNEIVPDFFPGRLFVPKKIQQIVDHLKGGAEVVAVGGQGRSL